MRKQTAWIISIVLALLVGIGGMYTVSLLFPAYASDKKVTNVNVTDTGLSASVSKLYDSVVVVQSYKGNSQIGSGTGFAYKINGDDGYIITNEHVISGADKVEVLFTNSHYEETVILGSDVFADIAVLKVKASSIISVANIGSSNDMKLGDTVFTIGAPVGSEYSGTVTRGIVSGKDRMVSLSLTGSTTNNDWIMRTLQTDAAINPGNSGGPLANVNGEVIGITSMKFVKSEIEGMGFCIPIEDAMKYAQILEQGKVIERPYIGIQLLDRSENYKLYLSGINVDSSFNNGIIIEKVLDDSSAKNNLKPGDIITEINDVKVNNKAEFRYQLYQYKIGDKIKIKLYRDKKELVETITLSK